MSEDTNIEEVAPALESSLDKALKRAEEKAQVSVVEETVDEESSEERPPMEWPLPVYPLVAMFDVQKVDLEDQQALVIALYTGAGASFGLVTRDGALALAKRLKQVANTVVEVKK